MKKTFIALISAAMILNFAACGRVEPKPQDPSDIITADQTASDEIPDETLPEPFDSQKPHINILSSGKTTVPYEYLDWETLLDGDTMISTVYDICDVESLFNDAPEVTYSTDFKLLPDENVTVKNIIVFDSDLGRLDGVELDDFDNLNPGDYYILVETERLGRSIKNAGSDEINNQESCGHGCAFKLTVHSRSSLLNVTSSGVTTAPFETLAYFEEWNDGWLCADGLDLSQVIISNEQLIPDITYGEDFKIMPVEGVDIVRTELLPALDLDCVLVPTEEDGIFGNAEAGKSYYLVILAARQGRYIESENRHESSGYNCVFRLHMPGDGTLDIPATAQEPVSERTEFTAFTEAELKGMIAGDRIPEENPMIAFSTKDEYISGYERLVSKELSIDDDILAEDNVPLDELLPYISGSFPAVVLFKGQEIGIDLSEGCTITDSRLYDSDFNLVAGASIDSIDDLEEGRSYYIIIDIVTENKREVCKYSCGFGFCFPAIATPV